MNGVYLLSGSFSDNSFAKVFHFQGTFKVSYGIQQLKKYTNSEFV